MPLLPYVVAYLFFFLFHNFILKNKHLLSLFVLVKSMCRLSNNWILKKKKGFHLTRAVCVHPNLFSIFRPLVQVQTTWNFPHKKKFVELNSIFYYGPSNIWSFSQVYNSARRVLICCKCRCIMLNGRKELTGVDQFE